MNNERQQVAFKLPPLPENLKLTMGDKDLTFALTQILHDYARVAVELDRQDREDAYIPKLRMDYVASITDSDPHITQREGYVEGWNDCRQDIIDHARRIEGEAK